MMAGDLARLDPEATAGNNPVLELESPAFQADLLAQPSPTEALPGREGLAGVGRTLAAQDAAVTVARTPAEAALPAGSGQEMADKLAQKMGEAMAQRLMSRLEQGHWQFRFVLHPKMMGEVQVNLQMQGGGLEGSLVSSHASTRELLSDGLQRLRDTLSASGMNVASLDVGAGHSSRQGQQSMAAQVAQPSAGPRGPSGAAPEEPAVARHRGSFGGEQGWDVLV
jgi:flagellar hook-length control protein FliK